MRAGLEPAPTVNLCTISGRILKMINELENYELELLLNAIEYRWGYDFRDYARASIGRRVKNVMSRHRIEHVSDLIPRVLYDAVFFQDMIGDFSITVTEMFRDTLVWQKIVTEVLPRLQSWPYFKIWHAACATGEEVWSMAILLKEAGLLERATIYATDFNDTALYQARTGIYPVKNMQAAGRNYIKAGGQHSLSEYYVAQGNEVVFDAALSQRIVWANHNLTTDRIFGEMNLIMCRNVLIYFTPALQNQVLTLFTDSLSHGGFLCLGGKETLDFTRIKDCYTPFESKEKIWCKKSYDDFVLPVLPEKNKPVITKIRQSKTEGMGIVAIGCSMGGAKALQTILPQLPIDFPLPIVITQHISASKNSLLAEVLQRNCALIVKDAEDGEAIKTGHIYLAPPDYHLIIEEDTTLRLSSEERKSYARPSIDMMFKSVAEVYGEDAIGVILTGANSDGSEGLANIRKAGGWALIEDPKTANTPSMPNAALSKAGANCVLPLKDIAAALIIRVKSMQNKTTVQPPHNS
jgi:chemotaxis protein methyltransferase CheR